MANCLYLHDNYITKFYFKNYVFAKLVVRVATVREKVLENEKFSRSGKSQGITFSVREIFKKNEKSHGKVREFQNFPKKVLVNRLLEILVSIICKQY